MNYPSEAEARVALEGVHRARQRVIDEIGMPWWYWSGLAACWIGLCVLSDVHAAWWAISLATLGVGAVHSTVAQRLLAGRQRTGDVRVRAEVAGRQAAVLVIGFLVALVAVTIGAALGLSADGAGHPATWAGVLVAVVILLGGPRMMAAIRDEATRRALTE